MVSSFQQNNLPISYLNEIIEYIKANVPEARAAAAATMKPQETQRVIKDGKVGLLIDWIIDRLVIFDQRFINCVGALVLKHMFGADPCY